MSENLDNKLSKLMEDIGSKVFEIGDKGMEIIQEYDPLIEYLNNQKDKKGNNTRNIVGLVNVYQFLSDQVSEELDRNSKRNQ